MKKILFVIYTYTLGGGAERILSDVVNNLNHEKYDITILPYADYSIAHMPMEKSVKVLPGIVDMEKSGKLEKIIKYMLVHFMPNILRKYYIRDYYDVEISFNYQIPSFLVKETSRTKTLEWNHGDVYDLKNSSIKKILQKRSYRRATKIIAISENTRRSICEVFPEFAHKIQLINNGINVLRIEKMMNQETNVKLKDPSIVFIGRLEEAKGPVRLLEALKRVVDEGKELNLYFLGQGEQRKEIEDKIKEWGLGKHAFLLGYQKNPYPIIKQSRAVCMLSKAEGFPTVFAEGMVLGKPFISSPVGGTLELSNEGKCGVIVNSIEECVEALSRVVLDKSENQKMSAYCKEHVKNYSMDRQIQTIEELLDTL